MKKIFKYFLLIILFCTNTSFAALTAQVDRTQIQAGETFTLMIRADKQTNARPDLSALTKQFTILGENKSQRISITNGNTTATTDWAISLMAKRNGKQIIPAITLANEKTKPLSITVSKPSAAKNAAGADEVFIETSLEPENPYIGSQMLYTMKLYYRDGLESGTLSQPETSNAMVSRLGKDINYRTTKHGKSYQVLERRYVLFPEKVGRIHIQPIAFAGVKLNRRRRGFGYTGRQTRINAVAPGENITVLAQPAAFTGTWLPATALSVKQHWTKQPPQFQVGEPMTRTIRITAHGLTGEQIPELLLPTIAGINTYSNKPIIENRMDNHGVIGERIEKIVYIPTQTGKLTIPEIRLAWFDTTTKKIRHAIIPALKTSVHPAAKTPHTGGRPAIISEPQTKTIANLSGAPIVHPIIGASTHSTTSFWPWLSLGLLLLWLSTLASWFWHKRRVAPKTETILEQHHYSQRKAYRKLKQACEQNDVRAMQQTCLQWAKLHWPDESITSLGDVARLSDANEFTQQCVQLDAALYGNANNAVDASQFWQAIQTFKTNNTTDKKTSDGLPPLWERN